MRIIINESNISYQTRGTHISGKSDAFEFSFSFVTKILRGNIPKHSDWKIQRHNFTNFSFDDRQMLHDCTHTAFDQWVIALCQFASEQLNAETGEDEHEHDEQHGHLQQNDFDQPLGMD